jgi:spermidine/putrescine transport system permease protein
MVARQHAGDGRLIQHMQATTTLPTSTPKPRRRTGELLGLVGPGLIWLIVFTLLPLLIVLAVSFGTRGTYGGVTWDLSFKQYTRLAFTNGEFDPLYLRILLRSLWIGLLATAICLVMGYPFAYYIARRPARWRGALMLLVLIPFWTNFLVRTYAWMFLFRDEGIINTILQALHITNGPLHMLFNEGAIVIGLVYGYLPFMVIPIYASIEKFDFTLQEAASDLGANGAMFFRRVLLPLTTPGIVAGSILVFIPCVGAYITPDLLGGAKVQMVGNSIQQLYLSTRDWPFGSAMSIVLMAIVLIATLLYFRVGGNRSELSV